MSALPWAHAQFNSAALNTGEAEVAVADDAERTRNQALPTALGQVLVRLSGDPDVVDRAIGEQLLANADDYLQSFTYRQPSAEPSDQAGRSAQALSLHLRVQFDARALRDALIAAQVRVWPQPGPTVLVWLAQEQNGTRALLDAESGAQWREAMRAVARERGFRLLFPLMDLTDLGALSYADIAGGFATPIRRASLRYAPDRVLAARLSVDASGAIAARWMLIGEAMAVERWRDQGAQAEPLARQAAVRLSEQLRADYALLPDLQARRRLSVDVEGIDSLATHQAVVARLQSLAGVERALVTQVTGNTATFELALSVDANQVSEAMARDARLVVDGDGYRWR